MMLSPEYYSLDDARARVRLANQYGVDQFWIPHLPDNRDSGLLASVFLDVAATATVGTAVMPIHAHNPVTTAQIAATLAEVSGGRFILGLGYGHAYSTEHIMGMKPGPPLASVREYVTIVRGLLDTGATDVDGKWYSAHAGYRVPHPTVPVVLAALRPRMIRLATQIADGIVLWMCSARYIAEVVTPTVRAGCREAGRDPDRFVVLAIVPTYGGAKIDEKRALLRNTIGAYAMLPNYRAALDHAGVRPGNVSDDALAELTLIGDADEIDKGLKEYRHAGALPAPSPTPAPFEEYRMTLESLYG